MPYDVSKDPFKDTLLNFGVKSKAVVPSDSTDFASYPKAVITASGGDLRVLPLQNTDGDTVLFSGIYAGFVVPFRVRRVLSTGTTCSVVTIE